MYFVRKAYDNVLLLGDLGALLPSRGLPWLILIGTPAGKIPKVFAWSLRGPAIRLAAGLVEGRL